MEKKHLQPALAVFAIAVLARVAFHFAVYQPFAERLGWAHYPGQFNWHQDDNYDEIANNLLSGNGFSCDGANPDIKSAPLYPFFLVLVFRLVGDGFWVNVSIQILLQSLVCVVLYFLTLRMFGSRRISIVSAAIWALYPLPMLQAMGPYTEPLYELLLAAFALSFTELHRSGSPRALVSSSILMALLTLTRPISIGFPVFFLAITLPRRSLSWRNRIVQVATLSAIVFAAAAPWIVRIHRITGEILPLTSNRPATYYATGKIGDVAADEVDDPEDGYKNFTERLAKETRDPSLFARRFLRRLGRFWYYGHSTPVRIVNGCLQFPLLLLAIAGIAWAKERGALIFPILATVSYFWLGYSAFLALSRYSFPMIVILCPLAAAGIVASLNRWKGRSDPGAARTRNQGPVGARP